MALKYQRFISLKKKTVILYNHFRCIPFPFISFRIQSIVDSRLPSRYTWTFVFLLHSFYLFLTASTLCYAFCHLVNQAWHSAYYLLPVYDEVILLFLVYVPLYLVRGCGDTERQQFIVFLDSETRYAVVVISNLLSPRSWV